MSNPWTRAERSIVRRAIRTVVSLRSLRRDRTTWPHLKMLLRKHFGERWKRGRSPAWLLALMLYCESRREARRNPTDGYIPLLEQDTGKWSQIMISEANGILAKAEQAGEVGPFQLEAPIQCIHAQRAATGKTNWTAIAAMYEGLVRLAPTIGAMVGRSAAFGEAYGPEAGLALLETIPRELVTNYQPYWAVSAHLLRRMERSAEALASYQRAIGLCEDAGMREFLSRQMAQLPDNAGTAPSR